MEVIVADFNTGDPYLDGITQRALDRALQRSAAPSQPAPVTPSVAPATEKEREAFEALAREKFGPGGVLPLGRMGDGYANPGIDFAWIVYKAARAAYAAPVEGGPPHVDHERVMEDAYALLWSVTTSNPKLKAARKLLREHLGSIRCGAGIERLCESGGHTNDGAMAETLAIEPAFRQAVAVVVDNNQPGEGMHLVRGINGHLTFDGGTKLYAAPVAATEAKPVGWAVAGCGDMVTLATFLADMVPIGAPVYAVPLVADARRLWQAITEEAEVVILPGTAGGKRLMLTEEMCVRLSAALFVIAAPTSPQPMPERGKK